jgi:pyruvate kinase
MGFSTQTPIPAGAYDDLIRQVENLRCFIVQQAEPGKEVLLKVPPERRQSAENLLHYLALRSEDIRPLQDRLARLGLSSLGRVESHVLATIDAVLRNLYLVSGQQLPKPNTMDIYRAFDAGADRLELNTIRLLGEYPKKRRVHIVVTVSEQTAEDYSLVLQLLKAGMNCMRINCVHGTQLSWSRMLENLGRASLATGQSCRVLMDLGGPKLRLGGMETEPGILKIKPERTSNGHVSRPARIWLSSAEKTASNAAVADTSIVLSTQWLAVVKKDDRIRFRDVRGSRRAWRIREVSADGCWAEAKKTAYLANGVVLNLHHGKGQPGQETVISSLPPADSVCRVRRGDVLFVSASDKPGTSEVFDKKGKQLTPGCVSLATPEVYRDARKGEPIYFDDGRIGGIIEKCGPLQLQIRITHTRTPLEKLEGHRGVNLPDTNLQLAALSGRDMKDMAFAARNADIIGLSFANSVDDVRSLYRQLQALGRESVGVVLKIETKLGFSRLPAMILEAMKFPACGVMIARGDLAVEVGFERMCEVQEEILWVCEAAHVPVIWATQVLEELTKNGHVTRAEITDAAMSQAAEAVMLNKGSHIIEAVKMLDGILQRMQGHHLKKRSMLRKLRLASEFYTRGRQPGA